LQKRIFDIAVSSLVIVFILSWLYPLLAIIIKKQSKGPVLFKQLRTGKRMNSGVTNLEVCTSTMLMKVNKKRG
jgi:lipopolysaccharide/colanic/teichoic acid biosynthesis glycosyltransferase